MKPKLITLLAVVALSAGCARFNTTQKEVRYSDRTEISTKATAYTLFAGKSALANWKAAQSEGSQSAEVGSLDQETAAGTNIALTVDAMVRLVEAIR